VGLTKRKANKALRRTFLVGESIGGGETGQGLSVA
jgi:hypothetical protein